MEKIRKPTIKEHYVPRMILKRHAAEINPKKNKYFIYLYDKKTRINKKVDIYDICYKKNLYELKDDNGNIIDRNRIENIFGCLEVEWSNIISKIENDEILSEEEECYIYILFALQILRVPESQEMAKKFLKKIKPTLSDSQAERYAKVSSLVAGEIKPEINFLLDLVLEPLSRKYITIYHSKIPFVLNYHQPVYAEALVDDIEWMSFYFPIAKFTCLALLVNKTDNTTINIPNNFARYLNRCMCSKTTRFVCSSEPIYCDLIQ